MEIDRQFLKDEDERPPRILFLHQNFPAQFGGLARYLKEAGWEVVFATANSTVPVGKRSVADNGVEVFGFRRNREPSKKISRYLHPMEAAVVNGQACASAMINLRESGFDPDIIVAHSGWGTGSFAKVVWPHAHFIAYLEWWYSWPPRDVPESELSRAEDQKARTLCRNLPFYLDLQTADEVWTPTEFQASDIPREFSNKVTVLHDGVDCAFFSPDPRARPACLEGKIPNGAPIITYATRGMEPKRGFPAFMAALEQVLQRYPDAHCVIAGNDSVHYEGKGRSARSYKTEALERHQYDTDRLHFVGKLPLGEYRDLLRVSDAHVYLTRPFVLSWSLIEAMACACPLVVSNNAPVREALTSSDQARFVDHHITDQLAEAIGQVLENPDRARSMGRNARKRALRAYATDRIYPVKEALLQLVHLRNARAKGQCLEHNHG